MENENVQVGVMQRTDKTLYIQVEVTSRMFPRSSMQGILEHGEHDNEAQAVGILAAAITEELCERLKDNITDPSTMAHAAVECYRELVADNPHIFMGNEMPRAADSSSCGGVGPH